MTTAALPTTGPVVLEVAGVAAAAAFHAALGADRVG